MGGFLEQDDCDICKKEVGNYNLSTCDCCGKNFVCENCSKHFEDDEVEMRNIPYDFICTTCYEKETK